MRVTVKLFALLGKYLPPGAADGAIGLEVPDGAAIGDVLARLGVPREHCHLVLVNGIYVAPGERDGHRLAAGDTLAVWPPVAGG